MDGYKLDLENKAFELAQYHNWMGLSKNGISLQDYIKTKKPLFKVLTRKSIIIIT